MIELLKRIPANKKLIVAGCLPLINSERLFGEVHFDGVVGPAAGREVVEVIRNVVNGERIAALKEAVSAKPSLHLPRLQLNPTISMIPVNYGCLGACAYCCVVFARGHLRSYSVREIVERVKNDLAKGAREFWITSQDTACYGRDIGTNLAELLDSISSIEGDYRIRVGMMTPNMATDILAGLIQAFKSEKIFKFIHLPVQSGDNQILKHMRRLYSVDDFKRIVDAFRANFPDITLATDVICGFPGERKPDIVNVSKFFVRPKTIAAEMKQDFVPFSEIKRRSRIMADLARKMAVEKNQKWLGWTGNILIDEVGKVSGSWVGRNFAYKPIAIENTVKLLGKALNVKVVRAFSTYLEGKLPMDDSSSSRWANNESLLIK
jgi:MiaB-like tRNA modifying enzyme